MIEHREFWQDQQGLDNIKPKRTGDNWESFNAVALASSLCGPGTVNDIGCGTGRMATGFEPWDYFGYDVNRKAIEIAQKTFTGYSFKAIEHYADIHPAEITLLHSAALHLPDDEVRAVFTLSGRRVVIGETMTGSTNRKPNPKPGLAFHYSRSAQDYVRLANGFKMVSERVELDRYSRKPFTYLVFEK